MNYVRALLLKDSIADPFFHKTYLHLQSVLKDTKNRTDKGKILTQS